MTNQFEERKAEILKNLAHNVQALDDYQKTHQLEFAYPETGPYARSLYKKQLEFFKAGKSHRFRLVSGGNGSGKSRSLAYEVALHATGQYPSWWEGKKYKKISTIWVVAKSSGTYRDSLQKHLFGNPGELTGTGLIPRDCILNTSVIPNSGGAIGTAQIRHTNGSVVSVEVKTFDMHRENLQGANVDLVAFDEEPPEDVYMEVIMRTRGTKTREPGISMLAFTPLEGLTNVVLRYLPNGMFPANYCHPDEKERWAIQITWADSPHLSEADKEAMLAEIPANLRDARSKGIPALGSGRVFPLHEADIVTNYLKIGPHWPRAFGLDFGWTCTAGIWGAKDPETGIIYLYGEYYQGHKPAHEHAYAIKQRGIWVPGVADSAGLSSNVSDGQNALDLFIQEGLNLIPAPKGAGSVAAGNAAVFGLLESGMLKVCYNLEHWLNEFRVYRYDPKDPNKIARNQSDHLMDATRYLISKFNDICISIEDIKDEEERLQNSIPRNDNDRNSITGY
jgi:phage terminase large subunit-like protein